MKTIIISLFLFAAIGAKSQITIPLDSITVGGIKFRATASFECMTWNARVKSVSLQWMLNVWGRDSSIVANKAIEQIADNSNYVYQDGSVVTDSIYFDSTNMVYKANGLPIIPEYTFYEMVAQYGAGGATINQLIQTAALRRKSIFKL